MGFWKKLKEWYFSDPSKKIEEEEFEKFIEEVEGRMDKIPSAQKAPTYESRASVALMFENAYTQKKLAETNNNLKHATWILAGATILFAYTAILDSPNSPKIFSQLSQLFLGVIYIIFIAIFLKIFGAVVGFLLKFFRKKEVRFKNE